MSTIYHPQDSDSNTIAQFVRSADQKHLPVLLTTQYDFVLSKLYQKSGNLYSSQNALSVRIDNKPAGMLWLVPSKGIGFLNISTWIQLLTVSPLVALHTAFIYRTRLAKRLRAHTSYIVIVSMLPEYRNHDVASELLREAERKTREVGNSVIELDVEKTNTDAKEFYSTRGFQIIFSHVYRQGDKDTEYLRMQKVLVREE